MAIKLSGTLKDPYGDPIPNAIIRFDAVRTSNTVVKTLRAEAKTATNGSYAISVEEGRYNISVKQGHSLMVVAKNLEVRSDSTAADLNDLLIEWQGEDDVTPAIILEFRALTDEARGYRDEAGSSADAAAASAKSANTAKNQAVTAKNQAQTSASEAAASEQTAAASKTEAAQSAASAKASETTATQKATAAAASASAAATSKAQANTAKNQAQTAAGDAASSEQAAADSQVEAAQSATEAAASAASVDAKRIVHTPGSGLSNEAGTAYSESSDDIVHRPGSGLPNAAGDIYSRNAAEFVPRSGGNLESGHLSKYLYFEDYDDTIADKTGIKGFVRDGVLKLAPNDNESHPIEMYLGGNKVWHAGNFDPDTKMNRRNLLINGCFRISQRSSRTIPSNTGFFIDRWRIRGTAASGGSGLIGHVTGNAGWAPGGAYVNINTTGVDATYITQRIENPEFVVGKTVTASIDAYFDNAATMQARFNLYHYDGSVNYNLEFSETSLPVDAHRGRVSWTMRLPSGSQTIFPAGSFLEVHFVINDMVDGGHRLGNAQVEVGDKATPFEVRHIAEEMALCQRYYYCPSKDISFMGHFYPINLTSGYRRLHIIFPVTMRKTPSITVEAVVNAGNISGISDQGTNPYSTQLQASADTDSGYISLRYFEADAEL